MNRALVIGDPHLKISNMETNRAFFRWVEDVVKDNDIKVVINLGDLFHTHSVLRAEIMGEYRQHIDRLKILGKGNIWYVHVLGNHEMFRPNDSTYHALQSYRDIGDRYVVVDKPIKLFGCTFVPYFVSGDDFPLATEDICFAHQTFRGADFGHILNENGVDAEAVSAKRIYSGHIHKRQVLGKVFYVGSPFAQGIDDVGETKGLHIVDLDDPLCDIEFIESPFPSWRAISCDISKMGAGAIDYIRSAIDADNNWTVTLTGPKAELTAILDSEELNGLRKAFKLRIKTQATDSIKVLKKIKSYALTDMIDEYVDNFYGGNLDPAELKREAQRFISINN
jgi:DNA repair exonuclease SbcCD nuclease subunit